MYDGQQNAGHNVQIVRMQVDPQILHKSHTFEAFVGACDSVLLGFSILHES